MVSSRVNDKTDFWAIDEALKVTTAPDQSGSGSNDNEGLFHIPLSSGVEPHHHT